MLTEEQREQYVETGGHACPYCGSDDIEGRIESDDPPYSDVKCNTCKREWRQAYRQDDAGQGAQLPVGRGRGL